MYLCKNKLDDYQRNIKIYKSISFKAMIILMLKIIQICNKTYKEINLISHKK